MRQSTLARNGGGAADGPEPGVGIEQLKTPEPSIERLKTLSSHVTFAPALMDKHTAAWYIGISLRKLDQLQAENRITPKALDGKRLYSRDELDVYARSLPEWVRE